MSVESGEVNSETPPQWIDYNLYTLDGLMKRADRVNKEIEELVGNNAQIISLTALRRRLRPTHNLPNQDLPKAA